MHGICQRCAAFGYLRFIRCPYQVSRKIRADSHRYQAPGAAGAIPWTDWDFRGAGLRPGVGGMTPEEKERLRLRCRHFQIRAAGAQLRALSGVTAILRGRWVPAVVCAWCLDKGRYSAQLAGRWIRDRMPATAVLPDQVSHGICDLCKAEIRRESGYSGNPAGIPLQGDELDGVLPDISKSIFDPNRIKIHKCLFNMY